MAIRSGFFNSVNGDRKYSASHFAEYFATFIGNGIFPNPSDGLQVIANNNMTITVKPGKAWINGYILINNDDYILEIEPADGGLNRIDRIVARYDVVDREIRLEVKKGTFASTPDAPALQRDADAYELGLADVYVGKGIISITQANITDLRLNTNLCGIVHGTVDQVDTTTLFTQYTQGFELKKDEFEQAFMSWFATLQDVLDDEAAGNLLNMINDLAGEGRTTETVKGNADALDAHLADVASPTKSGHVKVDNKTIFISDSGEISVTPYLLDDTTGSPGNPILIAGDMQEGFFGEVSSSQFITGDALASQVGISQGISQHSTAGWLKFAYKGKIQFVAKKPIRHSISWDAINTANCVYGDSGDKTIEIGGLTYKVRLLRALEPSNDPKTVASAVTGTINHYSEWNRLMCQIHEQAIDKSWDYPDNVESDIGILEHDLGNGTQGMYNDADLVVKSGDGRASWCQEMGTSTSYRPGRGYDGVSDSGDNTSFISDASFGWRPVLELVS